MNQADNLDASQRRLRRNAARATVAGVIGLLVAFSLLQVMQLMTQSTPSDETVYDIVDIDVQPYRATPKLSQPEPDPVDEVSPPEPAALALPPPPPPTVRSRQPTPLRLAMPQLSVQLAPMPDLMTLPEIAVAMPTTTVVSPTTPPRIVPPTPPPIATPAVTHNPPPTEPETNPQVDPPPETAITTTTPDTPLQATIQHTGSKDPLAPEKVVPKVIDLNEAMRQDGPYKQGLQVLRRVVPVYPESAVRRRDERDIRVEFTVNERGDIVDIKPIGRHPKMFTRSIRHALIRWKIQPPIGWDNNPVSISVRTEFNFRLP